MFYGLECLYHTEETREGLYHTEETRECLYHTEENRECLYQTEETRECLYHTEETRECLYQTEATTESLLFDIHDKHSWDVCSVRSPCRCRRSIGGSCMSFRYSYGRKALYQRQITK